MDVLIASYSAWDHRPQTTSSSLILSSDIWCTPADRNLDQLILLQDWAKQREREMHLLRTTFIIFLDNIFASKDWESEVDISGAYKHSLSIKKIRRAMFFTSLPFFWMQVRAGLQGKLGEFALKVHPGPLQALEEVLHPGSLLNPKEWSRT